MHRKRRGLTAQDLADATERFGHPLSRNTIASLESGRKELLSVQELVTVARALEVAPIALLYPVDAEATVTVPADPPTVVPGLRAAQWFTGEHTTAPDVTDQNIGAYGGGDYDETTGLYEFYETPENDAGGLSRIRNMGLFVSIGNEICKLITSTQDQLHNSVTDSVRDALRLQLGTLFAQLNGVLRAAAVIDKDLEKIGASSQKLARLRRIARALETGDDDG